MARRARPTLAQWDALVKEYTHLNRAWDKVCHEHAELKSRLAIVTAFMNEAISLNTLKAIGEYLEHGPAGISPIRGEGQPDVGVHPFVRWGITRLPEHAAKDKLYPQGPHEDSDA